MGLFNAKALFSVCVAALCISGARCSPKKKMPVPSMPTTVGARHSPELPPKIGETAIDIAGAHILCYVDAADKGGYLEIEYALINCGTRSVVMEEAPYVTCEVASPAGEGGGEHPKGGDELVLLYPRIGDTVVPDSIGGDLTRPVSSIRGRIAFNKCGLPFTLESGTVIRVEVWSYVRAFSGSDYVCINGELRCSSIRPETSTQATISPVKTLQSGRACGCLAARAIRLCSLNQPTWRRRSLNPIHFPLCAPPRVW